MLLQILRQTLRPCPGTGKQGNLVAFFLILFQIFNQKLKRRAQIQSDIAPRRNGTYTVTLAFNDDESQPILKMELMVPKEVMAKDLAERFQKNPEQLYTGVLNTLFSEPDEEK